MNYQQDHPSHLFLVRFWSDGAQSVQGTQDGQGEQGELVAQNQGELSGRVQHVLSGEARAFHDWPTLINMMLEMAASDDAEGIELEAPESD